MYWHNFPDMYSGIIALYVSRSGEMSTQIMANPDVIDLSAGATHTKVLSVNAINDDEL